jgi:hypothetical protein
LSVTLQKVSKCYSEIEKFYETRNDVSHSTRQSLQYVVKLWKQRLSQQCTGAVKLSTAVTEWLGMKSACPAEENTDGSPPVVCT